MRSIQDKPPGQAWDEAAQGWNEHGALIRQWLGEATIAMLDGAHIGPGDKVLDVAAGAGDQTVDLARRVGPGGTVLATDISARILELAASNARAAGLPQVSTRQADAQALGLADANFDAAICRLGLMFCTTPLLALREMRSTLVPGGRFGALVFSGPQANPCVTILMRTACLHAGVTPGDPFAPGSLLSLGRPGLIASLLHEAGFVDIDVRPLAAPMRAARCEDYVEFVRSSASPVIEVLKSLDPQAREEAWTDITRQLQQFATPRGWQGPNELLLCSAANPRAATIYGQP